MASIACRSARLWERSAAACSSAACSSCQLGERTYSSEPATAPGVRLSPTAPWPAPSDLERTTTARRPLEGVRGADFVAQGTAILDAGLLASTGGRGGTHRSRSGEKNDGWKNVGSGTFLNASGAMRGSERARWRQKGKFAHLMTSLETALGAARAFAPAPKHAGAARTIEAWLADIAMAVAIEQRGAARAVGCAAGRGGGRARDAGEGGCGEVEGLARDLYARVGDASDGVKRARAVEQ